VSLFLTSSIFLLHIGKGTFVRATDDIKNAELSAMGCSVAIDDVEEYITSIEARDQGAKVAGAQSWHTEYHDFEDSRAWWADLGNSSSLVDFTPSIGVETHEGRVMPGVKITAAADASTVPKFYW
jgi:hypothetical protein